VARDRVAVAATIAPAPEVAGVDELSHDPMRGAFGEPDLIAYLSQSDVRVARDAEQHLSVVAEKGPVGHGWETAASGIPETNFLNWDASIRGALDRKALVPYFKCVPCRIRVSAAGAGTALTDGSCPGCGSALEPVVKLTEVLGYRSPNLLDSAVPPRVAERVADISGGRAAIEAQLETDRWLDEGGSLAPEGLAEAIALDVPAHT
jgi:hypothetical protein